MRVGICDLSGGTLFFVLTAGLGAVLGGVWGAVVAEMCRGRHHRRLGCVVLSLAAPLAGIVVSVARFYGSPMIFAYDPFFGYFSGALYDTIVDVRSELWTYRAGSACTVAGALLVASALTRGESGLEPSVNRPAAFWTLGAGVLALAASVVVSAQGPQLGHWQTAATIAAALGGRASGPRCDVMFPDSLLKDQVALLVRDCEEELAADERRLGVRLSSRLVAFFFVDSDQKRRLMGAGGTSIAKPWRSEVYLQVAPYPHPLLGHEIAHVVAGAVAKGPFRVGASAGGWLPNPGLIEGTAVALSPDDDELTDEQWARAMMDLGTLPEIRSLFSLDFLGRNADLSYTVAGAFVGWVLDTWGSGVVRAWYGGVGIDRLTGLSWRELEQRFRGALAGLSLPAEAAVYARARFERPSVWGRSCPHVVDALDRQADLCRDAHRVERADEFYARALARDAHDMHARFDRARLAAWYGNRARGREELTALAADERAPRTWRDRADEVLADQDFVEGRVEDAAREYGLLASHTLDEDAARTLEVKALSASEEEARVAVGALLIGEPGRPLDGWDGPFSVGLWLGRTAAPLASYLAGKNLARHGDWAKAARWLDDAIDAGIRSPRIARELLRVRAVCACALHDDVKLDVLERAVAADDSPFRASRGRRGWLLALIDRCRDPVQTQAAGP